MPLTSIRLMSIINTATLDGIEAATGDLAHIIKIFQEGASKLTLAIKMYA